VNANRQSTTKTRSIVLVAGLAMLGVASCNESDDPGHGAESSAGGKADDADDAEPIDTRGYAFVLDDEAFSVRRDHAGAPLLATIWGRIGEYSEEAPNVHRKAYDSKPGSLPVPWLLHITKTFLTIHESWAPSFEEMGLDPCDALGITDDWADLVDENGDVDFTALSPEQCFFQRVLWPDPETGELLRYRRTISVAIPDYLTVELDKPPGFPNGRVLHEQINSLMFALAFLDHGGDCQDDDGVVTPCNLHTLWRRSDFLKPQNDVPFFGAAQIGDPPARFPFLAPAHRSR
jgi:hypothetical protein